LDNIKRRGFYLFSDDIDEDLPDCRSLCRCARNSVAATKRKVDDFLTVQGQLIVGRSPKWRPLDGGGHRAAPAAERVRSQTEGSVNSDAVSENPVSEEDRQWFASAVAELSADETIPRVSRLTALIVMIALSLGTWAAIWAAVASLCRG
jgi:hypothetical protein